MTFTATVAGNNPTGSVSFTENGNCHLCGGHAQRQPAHRLVQHQRASRVGVHSIVANYGGDPGNAASSSAPLSQTISAPTGSSNVALASAGAVASASSTLQRRLPGGRGQQQRAGRGQPGQRRLLERRHPEHVAGLGADRLQRQQDHRSGGGLFAAGQLPQPGRADRHQTFSLYGLTSFTVEGRNGANWVTLATVSGNNLVKRTVSFAAYTTDSIRITITGTTDSWSRITEIEAWGIAAGGLPATTTTLTSAPNPASFRQPA